MELIQGGLRLLQQAASRLEHRYLAGRCARGNSREQRGDRDDKASDQDTWDQAHDD
jgi:hypothetical protein